MRKSPRHRITINSVIGGTVIAAILAVLAPAASAGTPQMPSPTVLLSPSSVVMSADGGKITFHLSMTFTAGSKCGVNAYDTNLQQSAPTVWGCADGGGWKGTFPVTVPARPDSDTYILTVWISGPGERSNSATATITQKASDGS